ncbi:unnamed protein product [Phyllotreta striolata]|uniref:Gamma-interferon-inducible lysosomal thiol reductase n=1 Tax=Phyllotreta striolata TaxID=444603 RepID=A0A9N9TUT6_PHYSR|nr:unnamed protein product [Phyllotreta striolata]
MKWLPVVLFFVTNIYANNLKVTILYESLCPDSVNFLKNQFYPTYNILKEKLDVELVPFGKANATKINNTWYFHCQHKEAECYGNKVQSCAIDLTPKNVSVEFVMCAMKSGDASDDTILKQCAGDSNVTWSDIENCLNSGKGDALLAKNGEKTNELRPNIPMVPTIILNGVYSEAVQNLALKNFQDLAALILEEQKSGGDSSIDFSKKIVFFAMGLYILLVV